MKQSQPPTEPLAELETTESGLEIAHLSGRRNAQLAAVVVVGILIAVVWVGVSGRTNPPPVPPVSFPPVAEAPTGIPSSAPTLSPQPSIDVEPQPTSGPPAIGDVFGVYAELGDAQFITILDEPEPGHLVGHLRLPLPMATVEGVFAFQQFSSATVPGQPVPIADWPITVDLPTREGPAFTAVSATLPARRTVRNAPRPVERGYHLTVVAQRKGNVGELIINIRIGPNRQLQGNDGILGWPVVSQLRKPQVDRTQGRYNYCRWDVGAMAAPPRPGTDEADC